MRWRLRCLPVMVRGGCGGWGGCRRPWDRPCDCRLPCATGGTRPKRAKADTRRHDRMPAEALIAKVGRLSAEVAQLKTDLHTAQRSNEEMTVAGVVQFGEGASSNFQGRPVAQLLQAAMGAVEARRRQESATAARRAASRAVQAATNAAAQAAAAMSALVESLTPLAHMRDEGGAPVRPVRFISERLAKSLFSLSVLLARGCTPTAAAVHSLLRYHELACERYRLLQQRGVDFSEAAAVPELSPHTHAPRAGLEHPTPL